MAERDIPARKIWTCDGCKVEAEDRFPSNWTKLHIKANALDYQGCAVADASVSRDLCSACTSLVHKAVNESIATIRQQKEPT